MNIISKIRQELQDSVDSKTKQSTRRFFKEDIKFYGVKVPTVAKIAAKYFSQIKNLDKNTFFELCEELLKSGYIEEAFVAYKWAESNIDKFGPEDFGVLERWLDSYVSNWAECDTLCNHALGSFVEKFPQFLENIKDWTQSQNRWVKRGAATTLVLPARKGLFLDVVFEIADKLLLDTDDLVQKGYGWMLKEASKSHQTEVFNYIMKNRAVMPRTALRYAIEKMPQDLRKKAIEK
ncbi:MAG: DNA alkylation repair protein [Candidatus Bathyarchaeota archaeon]|nr:DNA alkylation repair protein [Candidatus Bathyarchaeota archaeon]